MTASDHIKPGMNDQVARAGDVVALPYQLLFLITDTSPDWYRAFYAALTPLPTLQSVSNPAYFEAAVSAHRPDAIIACAEGPCRAFYARLVSMAGHPLCVLVVHDDEDEPGDDFPADTVVSASARALQRAVRAGLKMQRELAALAEHNATLAAEVAEKYHALEQSRQIVDEVTLLKESIIANVSHELRTPLLHLRSAISLMSEERQSVLVDYAKQATARIDALVQNISQLASSLSITIHPLIVREVVEQAERNLRRSWQHHESIARVVFLVEDHLPPVLGDRQGIMTAIFQLVDNALKFSEGQVEVQVYQDGDTVAFSVLDQGIGIDESDLRKIFEMFYQVDSGSTRRYSGTGIGLAIVRLILDKHDVDIEVQSRKGDGSSFTFRLKQADLQRDLGGMQV